jgi:hypothetical protein
MTNHAVPRSVLNAAMFDRPLAPGDPRFAALSMAHGGRLSTLPVPPHEHCGSVNVKSPVPAPLQQIPVASPQSNPVSSPNKGARLFEQCITDSSCFDDNGK